MDPGAAIDAARDTEFVLLPPTGRSARVRIGSPPDESDRHVDEAQRDVDIAPFLMARTELTQRIYSALGGEHAAYRFAGAMNPVENASAIDADKFLSRVQFRVMRLPSEAEWEYACRGGTATAFCFGRALGAGAANVGTRKTEPVATIGVANAFGLFDVHGNVAEWTRDTVGPATPQLMRATCGGAWQNVASSCRSATRGLPGSDVRCEYLGFRASRSISKWSTPVALPIPNAAKQPALAEPPAAIQELLRPTAAEFTVVGVKECSCPNDVEGMKTVKVVVLRCNAFGPAQA